MVGRGEGRALGHPTAAQDQPCQPLHVQNTPSHSSLPTQELGHPCPPHPSLVVPAGASWSHLALGQVPGAMDLSVLLCCCSLDSSSHPPDGGDHLELKLWLHPLSPTPPNTQPEVSFSFPSVAGAV